MKRFLRGETVVGCVLFVLGLVYLYGTRVIKITDVATLSDKFMPRLSGILLLFFSAAMVIMDQIKASKEESVSLNKGRIIRLLAIMIVFAVTVALLKPLGFIISMTFFLMCMFFMASKKGARKPLLLIALALVIPAGVFFLFLNAFSVLLPQGILKF